MSTNSAPIYSFGSFNASFFSSSSYVAFPIAQGTETFPKILTNNIDTVNPSTSVSLFDSTTTGHIEIGASQTTGDIFVGSATSTVSFLNGLTLANGKGITCSTTSYTPSITQLGYSTIRSLNVITATTTPQLFATTPSLIKGVYLIYITAISSNASNASAICQIYQNSISGCTTTLDPYNIGCNGLNATIPICFFGVLNVTSNTNSLVYFCAMSPNGTIQFNNVNCGVVRIA
jgi:hypothetical protein